MDITAVLASLEALPLAAKIRASLYLFPFIESLHVLGLTMVFGTIAILDLRMLGIASTRRPVSRIESDVLKWAWAAFARTWTSGSRRASTSAGMTTSSIAAAFIQPAEAILRISPSASLSPDANAVAASGG